MHDADANAHWFKNGVCVCAQAHAERDGAQMARHPAALHGSLKHCLSLLPQIGWPIFVPHELPQFVSPGKLLSLPQLHTFWGRVSVPEIRLQRI